MIRLLYLIPWPWDWNKWEVIHMDLVAVRDGDRVLYVETGRIREIVIHPQLHKVPGAPGNVGGVLIYEGKPLTFYCLGYGNEISCAFILGGQDDALCAVCGEPVGEENGDQEELVRVLTGVWEKSE